MRRPSLLNVASSNQNGDAKHNLATTRERLLFEKNMGDEKSQGVTRDENEQQNSSNAISLNDYVQWMSSINQTIQLGSLTDPMSMMPKLSKNTSKNKSSAPIQQTAVSWDKIVHAPMPSATTKPRSTTSSLSVEQLESSLDDIANSWNSSESSFTMHKEMDMGAPVAMPKMPSNATSGNLLKPIAKKEVDRQWKEDWSSRHYEWTDEILEHNYSFFGHTTGFRDLQRESINAILSDHDVFVMMPTGGGKSLCFQLPALYDREKLSVVVMPLVSLMTDQYELMNELGLPCAYFTGSTTYSEVQEIQEGCYNGQIRLLFVTPEKIQASEAFNTFLRRLYQNQKLARFVIDEAHCVSQWGNDFRKDYLQLSSLRRNYPTVPIAAFTATATREVIKDVVNQLNMRDPQLFQRSFDRTNLKFEVRMKKKANLGQDIFKLLQEPSAVKASAIVYCFSQKECVEMADQLRAKGVKALPYHAGLGADERQENQLSWMNDRVRVICATIAFGMGINKKDVRVVIHTTMPKTLENYYQEAGRAGRDGNSASCILFYDYQDKTKQQSLMMKEKAYIDKSKMDSLVSMTRFCESTTHCRRSLILAHFGEIDNADNSQCAGGQLKCDNCDRVATHTVTWKDVTNESRDIIKTLRAIGNRSNGKSHPHSGETVKSFTEFLMGASNKRIKDRGMANIYGYGGFKKMGWKSDEVSRLIKHLICAGAIAEVMVKLNTYNGFANVTPYLAENMTTSKYPLDRVPIPSPKLAYLSRAKPMSVQDSAPFGVHTSDVITVDSGNWIDLKHGANKENSGGQKTQPGMSLTKSELIELEQHLKDCRERLALSKGIKNHSSVLTQRGIKWLRDNLPMTIFDLKKCTDFGINKITKYGQSFIDEVAKYLKVIGKTELAMTMKSDRDQRRVAADDDDDSNEMIVLDPVRDLTMKNKHTSLLTQQDMLTPASLSSFNSKKRPFDMAENSNTTEASQAISYLANPLNSRPDLKKHKAIHSQIPPVQTRLDFGSATTQTVPTSNQNVHRTQYQQKSAMASIINQGSNAMPSLDDFDDFDVDWAEGLQFERL